MLIVCVDDNLHRQIISTDNTSTQVYAINDVPASLLIQLAVLLSSPLLFLLSNTGAVLGSLTALTFLPPADYQQVRPPAVRPNTAVF